MENNQLVSEVIATKNEEKNIADCLKSLKAQNYPNIEIIVIDNGSNDRTIDIAQSLIDNVFELETEISLDGIRNFRGAQVNLGVEKSKGDIIFFPDADMTFDRDLIEEAVNKLKQSAALYVPEAVCGKGFLGKVRNFERSFYNETSIDAVRFVKRELFEKVGGFDEKNIAFSTDDWDLTKMIKRVTSKITITKNKLYHNEAQISLGKYLKKKSQYMDTFDDYIAKWGKNDPDIKKQFGFKYRFLGVFFEKGKWIRLVIHPILAAGMYGLKIIIGIMFLCSKK